MKKPLPRAKKSSIPNMHNIPDPPLKKRSRRNFLKINDRLIDLNLIEYCDIEEVITNLNGKSTSTYILKLKMPRANLNLQYIFNTIEEAREVINFIAEQAQIKSFDLKPEQVCFI